MALKEFRDGYCKIIVNEACLTIEKPIDKFLDLWGLFSFARSNQLINIDRLDLNKRAIARACKIDLHDFRSANLKSLGLI